MPTPVDSPDTATTFHSILYCGVADEAGSEATTATPPDCFPDLNLNQVIDTVTAGREEYHLNPFFYTPLADRNTILYRQQIMKDLENPLLFQHIVFFSKNMQEMRKALPDAAKSRYKYQRERLFLDAVRFYLEAVMSLKDHLLQDAIKSQGLIAFREYLVNYINDEAFVSPFKETKKLQEEFSAVRYSVHIKELLVQVLPYNAAQDYSREITSLFEKFSQHPAKDYRVEFPTSPEMNHVEASILEGVAQLYPDLFHHLDSFCEENKDYQNQIILAFDREIQFYVAYLEYITGIKENGLSFCYPEISDISKEVCNEEGFDLALAHRLVNKNSPVITNNFYLKGEERIIIVTGPNQGGKTTFARTFGQLHYLACLGCPVPGREAKLFLFDRLFTHFEKEEDISTHRSKFEEDLYRINVLLRHSTSDSLIIMNEILSSTTLQDAVFISKIILERIIRKDTLCVWITFIDELTTMSSKIVSMTSMVEKENPASRTYKIMRRPADGLAYALSIAEKYRVTYPHLKERLKR